MLVLAAILGVAFYVPYTLNKSSDERYVDDVIPLNSLVRDIVNQMATAEAAVHAHLLTDDKASLRRYDTALTQARKDVSGLGPYLERHPSLTPLTKETLNRMTELQVDLETQLIDVRAEGRSERDARTRLRRIAASFNRVDESTDKMLQMTQQFVRDAQTEQEDRYRRLLVALGWLGAMGLALGGVLLVYTPRRLGELYAAERRLRRQAEERADAARALAHVTDGVLLTDRSGDVRFWNPAAAKLLELDEEDALGRRLPDLLPTWSSPARQSNGGADGGPV